MLKDIIITIGCYGMNPQSLNVMCNAKKNDTATNEAREK